MLDESTGDPLRRSPAARASGGATGRALQAVGAHGEIAAGEAFGPRTTGAIRSPHPGKRWVGPGRSTRIARRVDQSDGGAVARSTVRSSAASLYTRAGRFGASLPCRLQDRIVPDRIVLDGIVLDGTVLDGIVQEGIVQDGIASGGIVHDETARHEAGPVAPFAVFTIAAAGRTGDLPGRSAGRHGDGPRSVGSVR